MKGAINQAESCKVTIYSGVFNKLSKFEMCFTLYFTLNVFEYVQQWKKVCYTWVILNVRHCT